MHSYIIFTFKISNFIILEIKNSYLSINTFLHFFGLKVHNNSINPKTIIQENKIALTLFIELIPFLELAYVLIDINFKDSSRATMNPN